MFWRVAGFSQPSPIEQILDKEDFTLDELLDEDDLVQECKSLNGRLIAFLREKNTVDQLLRYLVENPKNSEDPKRHYKYPFTATEVFCCEIEAVFNTLLEDGDLMRLLFSPLEEEAPLNCKTAGLFGRVVSHLLLRKVNEIMQYLQENPKVLEKLINHIDTTSIADVVKKLVGADEQSSMLYVPAHTQWLAETPLVDMLLQRLGSQYSSDVQQNAADILTAIAHTQPSPIAAKLTKESSVRQLFQHALAAGRQVLVPALDVCIALLEPKRFNQESFNGPMADGNTPTVDPFHAHKDEAVAGMLQFLAQLVEQLQQEPNIQRQEQPYGVLVPPLGSARLKVTQLLAVLLRSGDAPAEAAIIGADAIPRCLELFVKYPFNNMLHHHVGSMLMTALNRLSEPLLMHLFERCKVVEWILNAPRDHIPVARPGYEAVTPSKPPLRAGYLGHVTRISNKLVDVGENNPLVGNVLAAEAWQRYVAEELNPRNDLENVNKWACGRPQNTDLTCMNSDDDEEFIPNTETAADSQDANMYNQPPVAPQQGDEEADDDDEEDEDVLQERVTPLMGASRMGGEGGEEGGEGANSSGFHNFSHYASQQPLSHAIQDPVRGIDSMAVDSDDQVRFDSDEDEPLAVSAEEIMADISDEPMASPGSPKGGLMDEYEGPSLAALMQSPEPAPAAEPETPAVEFGDLCYWKTSLNFAVPDDA